MHFALCSLFTAKYLNNSNKYEKRHVGEILNLFLYQPLIESSYCWSDSVLENAYMVTSFERDMYHCTCLASYARLLVTNKTKLTSVLECRSEN